MSRALMTLLGKTHDKMFEIVFADLEKSTGDKTVDAKLVGDILHRAHRLIQDMGLSKDTTAKELYYALRMHDELLDDSTAYAGIVIDGEVVSLNSQDVAEDYEQSRHFADRTFVHLHDSLAREITRRYTHATNRPGLLKQLEKYTIHQRKENI